MVVLAAVLAMAIVVVVIPSGKGCVRRMGRALRSRSVRAVAVCEVEVLCLGSSGCSSGGLGAGERGGLGFCECSGLHIKPRTTPIEFQACIDAEVKLYCCVTDAPSRLQASMTDFNERTPMNSKGSGLVAPMQS